MARSVRGLALLLLATGLAFTLAAEPPSKAPPEKAAGKPAVVYRFSGPYTHDNLTIFLVHGDDQIQGKDILTLDEALKQKKVVVHETKNVNELAIENVSPDEVFVQAGDIVRGGQQDRTIAFDSIVPPKSGRLPLASFCVEAGRWTQRGKEVAGQFSSSANCLANNGLKIAARKGGAMPTNQNSVWENVAKCQEDLKRNIKADVKAGESKSSLELTLEHKKVVEAINAYVKKLQASPEDKKDVIGYAVVINGKVNNADIYASNGLFKKLWPKLLKASAVEAISEWKKDQKFEPATAEAVKAFLADAEKGKKTEKKITERFKQVEQESAKNILFETRDRDNQGAPRAPQLRQKITNTSIRLLRRSVGNTLLRSVAKLLQT